MARNQIPGRYVSHELPISDSGIRQSSTALCEAAEKYIIEKKPELLAICFEEPDHTGHTKGHDTPAYYQMLKELDGYVERILQAIKKPVYGMTPLLL